MGRRTNNPLERLLGKNWIAILALLGALATRALSSTNWFITTYADKPYVEERFSAAVKYTNEKFTEAMHAVDLSNERTIAHSNSNKAEMMTEIRAVSSQVKEMEVWLHERIADRRAEKSAASGHVHLVEPSK